MRFLSFLGFYGIGEIPWKNPTKIINKCLKLNRVFRFATPEALKEAMKAAKVKEGDVPSLETLRRGPVHIIEVPLGNCQWRVKRVYADGYESPWELEERHTPTPNTKTDQAGTYDDVICAVCGKHLLAYRG